MNCNKHFLVLVLDVSARIPGPIALNFVRDHIVFPIHRGVLCIQCILHIQSGPLPELW